MSKIIISFWSKNGKVFYETLANSFCKNGNDVFYLDMSEYIDFQTWGEDYTLNNKAIDLEKQIKEFAPDLVLSFNNVFPHTFVEKLNCPICVLDADIPDIGFWNKKVLKNNKDRYVFLGFQKASLSLYEKTFGNIKKYLYFPPATLVQKENIIQDKQISFIGSNFLYLTPLLRNGDVVKDKELFETVLTAYKNLNGTFCNDFEEFRKFIPTQCDEKIAKQAFNFFKLGIISGYERVSYLSVLSDLGLKLYGLTSWRSLLYYDLDLAMCFDDTPIISLKDNQQIYNSSKISINISHKQAISSFSWRVMDIMASNACLLMEDKNDWKELFASYLSKETLETVIYKNRYDLREKVQKLLSDEALRLRCVADLNKAIEQNGRWEKRYKLLEDFLGITLLSTNKSNKKHKVVVPFIIKDAVIAKNNVTQKGISKKLKTRTKLFFYSGIAMLLQFPFLDLLFKEKYRQKILSKLIKYWR